MINIAGSVDEMAGHPSAISPGIVCAPQQALTLTGESVPAEGGDLIARIVSSGNVHRALPATRTICTAVAARIEGTVVHRVCRSTSDPKSDLRLVHPSGVTVLAAFVEQRDGEWFAEYGTIYRTQRRLFEGVVCVPAAKVPGYLENQQPLAKASGL